MNLIRFEYFNHVNDDFIRLTNNLDIELREKNGELEKLYTQYNQLDNIKDIVIVYVNNVPIACCSMKLYTSDIFELKRVFVDREYRKQGFARQMLEKLEAIAIKKGIKEIILETGLVLGGAIKLYKSIGYNIIENYGQYKDMKESICMKKSLEE